jgi:all-trans-retinol dehydrogenase (NAD+)
MDEDSVPMMILEMLKAVFVALAMCLLGAVKALLPASLLPKKSVSQEIILVTGAGSGIGRLLALKLSDLGARLVLWDVNEKGNEETKKMIVDKNGEAHSYTIDLCNREEVYALADKVRAQVGEVDMLINNAGIVTGRRYMDCPDSLIVKTMEVNVMSHFWTVKAFLPGMMQRNHGHIVSVASAAGLFGAVDLADYCASKFAAVGFNESLSIEIDTRGYTGVFCTTVCPYYINTGMFDGVQSKYNFMLPLLEPDYVADKIIEGVQTNQEYLMIPRLIYFLYYLRGVLPVKVGYYLSHTLGVTHSMDQFKGRNQPNGAH